LEQILDEADEKFSAIDQVVIWEIRFTDGTILIANPEGGSKGSLTMI